MHLSCFHFVVTSAAEFPAVVLFFFVISDFSLFLSAFLPLKTLHNKKILSLVHFLANLIFKPLTSPVSFSKAAANYSSPIKGH